MQDKGKSKAKDRNKSKGKEKQVREGPVYDYEDASVQDAVLKVEIMRAYERFKVCLPYTSRWVLNIYIC